MVNNQRTNAMMIEVKPTSFQGIVELPVSKSWSHRALMLASLSSQPSQFDHLLQADDIDATITCLRAMGATLSSHGGQGPLLIDQPLTLQARASGTTLRMLLPFTMLGNVPITWQGNDRLPFRDLEPFQAFAKQQHLRFEHPLDAWLPLIVQGPLRSGDFTIDGSVSSQFISGLLMILPTLEGDSTLTITGKYTSRPYVELTIRMMAEAGVHVKQQANTFLMRGSQTYQGRTYQAERDHSHSVFFLLGAALSGQLILKDIGQPSFQGDHIIQTWLQQAGGNFVINHHDVHVQTSLLTPFDVDLSDYPDLALMLIATSGFITGTSRFTSVGRLNDKESPRLDVICEFLSLCHIPYTLKDDVLIVEGHADARIPNHMFSSHGDHRMAMTLCMLAPKAQSSYRIDDVACVKKSFPGFLDVYASIQGQYHVLGG
jgi:3-phosphoshikimate 1-carboxyvinyltransferase